MLSAVLHHIEGGDEIGSPISPPHEMRLISEEQSPKGLLLHAHTRVDFYT